MIEVWNMISGIIACSIHLSYLFLPCDLYKLWSCHTVMWQLMNHWAGMVYRKQWHWLQVVNIHAICACDMVTVMGSVVTVGCMVRKQQQCWALSFPLSRRNTEGIWVKSFDARLSFLNLVILQGLKGGQAVCISLPFRTHGQPYHVSCIHDLHAS